MKVLFIAALCFASSLATVASGAKQAPVPQIVDELIPVASRVVAPDFTLSDVYGKRLQLSKYKGKVVLLDFWAISCGGCKLELPWYVAFDAQYRSRGLTVIGLDMYGDSPEAIRPFLMKSNIHYAIAVGTDAIGESFGLKEMPLTLLIDRNGKIALSHAGVVNKDTFERAIQRLL